MNDKKTYKIIENIKSLLIVVLFLSAILLLYFFWTDQNPFRMSFSDFYIGGGENFERSLYVGDVLLPSRMEVVKDSGEMAVITDSAKYYGSFVYVDTFLGSVRNFLTSGEIVLEEVPKEQYEEAYRFASVKCCFDYYLPGAEYLSYLGVEKLAGMENIGSVREVGFVLGAPESLLIRDGSQSKYFRIVSDQADTFVARMMVDEEVQAMPNYYPISEFMGAQVENSVKLPLTIETDLAVSKASGEIDSEESERITGLARTFFGDTFDFVRKLGDASGRVTYMYGYAETVLIVDKDGSVEYKSESDASANISYFQALDMALAFIDSHSFAAESEKNMKLRPYLSDVGEILSGARGYRFEFGLKDGCCEIFCPAAPIVVEVTGGKISYYYRNVPAVEKASGKMQEAFSAVNTIALNYEKLKEVLGEELSIDAIADRIVSMKYGYLVRDGEAIPAWEIALRGTNEKAYFDLYTAEPLE